ncbi:MAG: alanyl-tRNA editing protein AlaXM [Desulfurococcaceae archaeon]
MSVTTKLVYQYDSYLREHETILLRSLGNILFFDSTIFHPRSGGVDHDKGFILVDNEKIEVLEVYIDKDTGEVAHKVGKPISIQPGTRVKMILDWDRRYKLMRLHTAAHILSAVMYNEYGALISGGNITPEYAYDDYTIEKFDKDIFLKAIEKANEIIKMDLEVKIYWLPREEALKIPGVVKLAARTPPDIKELRIVEIPGVDIQADGGPHVKRTSEIGEIVFLKAENKGKNKKRLYFSVK